MKTIWQDYDLQDILDYFARDFKIPAGERVERLDWFYDSQKQRIVFRLFITEKKNG